MLPLLSPIQKLSNHAFHARPDCVSNMLFLHRMLLPMHKAFNLQPMPYQLRFSACPCKRHGLNIQMFWCLLFGHHFCQPSPVVAKCVASILLQTAMACPQQHWTVLASVKVGGGKNKHCSIVSTNRASNREHSTQAHHEKHHIFWKKIVMLNTGSKH